ncbi:MAG: molybdopterin synthase sulfur carrier subunit [Gemmataceae bacterium]|nr:molybdopterin synthase sulfur carrier subunit [Gemmataceae bacterium]
MTLTVHLFARARDLAGSDAVSIDVPAVATVADLRLALTHRFPALGDLLARSAVAVNHDFADDLRPLSAGDEVAVIPPVSGG